MKKQYILTLISGIILLAIGIFFELFARFSRIISLIFISAGTIMMAISVLKYNTLGAGVSQDERTRKLSGYAISVSWLLTFLLINLLFWIDYFNFISLSSPQILGIILFFMVLSASILQWIYKRKGDLK